MRYTPVSRKGPVGLSETATPAMERAYMLPPAVVCPSECHHSTHLPVDSLKSTLGRSKMVVSSAASLVFRW